MNEASHAEVQKLFEYHQYSSSKSMTGKTPQCFEICLPVSKDWTQKHLLALASGKTKV